MLFPIFMESQTDEMEERLKTLGESALRKFTLDDTDGPYSVYQFEGQDWKDKTKEVYKEDIKVLSI